MDVCATVDDEDEDEVESGVDTEWDVLVETDEVLLDEEEGTVVVEDENEGDKGAFGCFKPHNPI